jgi:UDPglucose--hexose-1-phosphate uridylyltransferase
VNINLPHRRYNPLTREWLLVSPHRAKRPWLGQVEKVAEERLPAYDPTCYLCPGNERVGGVRNPAYTGTYVFDNDFMAVLPPEQMGDDDSGSSLPRSELFRAEPVTGVCRVVNFSPRHDLSLPLMALPQIEAVLRTWAEQTQALGSQPDIGYVQVFENKGSAMGASNPHPHSQLWATSEEPTEVAKELTSQRDYFERHGRPLVLDVVAAERAAEQRVVASNDHFTAVVPFWAVWPFEILLMAHRPVAYLYDLGDDEVTALAEILKQVLIRYDNLFEVSFPYSMGWHQAPTDGQPHPEWVLHAHFYPPLLRSATVRKFMVGYEMLAMPQRDLTAETAAARLRAVPDVHYRSQP